MTRSGRQKSVTRNRPKGGLAHWWLAGDETGNWDLIGGEASAMPLGVALVLGTARDWVEALSRDLEGRPAFEVFSRPLAGDEGKYHLMDIWQHLRDRSPIRLETPESDPWRERLRLHGRWLLEEAGLAVLTLGGRLGAMREAGYVHAGDPAVSRAAAFAALFATAAPFLDLERETRILLMMEERSEPSGARGDTRLPEPRRLFQDSFRRDVAQRCQDLAPLLPKAPRPEDAFHPFGRRFANEALQRLAKVVGTQPSPRRLAAVLRAVADLAAAFAIPPGDGDSVFREVTGPHLRRFRWLEIPWR